jgi:hypothetical protein
MLRYRSYLLLQQCFRIFLPTVNFNWRWGNRRLMPVQKFCYLHKEIFEKKNNKVGKNKFYKEQKQVKNCVSKYLKLWN